MKFIYYTLCVFLFQPDASIAQSSEISSLQVYRRGNETWRLISKIDFIRTKYIQSNINYKWEDNKWQKASVHTREISLNEDTIQTYIINYTSDQPKRSQFGKSYKVRNDSGQQVGVMFEFDGKVHTSEIPEGFTPLESLPGGLKLSYPFQSVFQEADKLMAQGEAIENIKPTYQVCRELQRPDIVYTLAVNDQNQLVSFESDSTKVLVIYNNENSEPEPYSSLKLIYPNPFYDELFISLNETDFEQFNVTNSLGETVHSNIVDRNQPVIQINLSHLPTGIYFVNFLTEKSRFTTKIVKINGN